MNVIQDGKLIKTIQVSPDSTVLKIKQSLPAYKDSMVKLIFNDGTEIAGVVFTTDKYDMVDFKQYKNVLKDSNLYITSVVSQESTDDYKELEFDVKSTNLKPMNLKPMNLKPLLRGNKNTELTSNSPLSGNKNTDLMILSELNDRDLLNTCLIKNKYINGLCNNDTFWRNRFVKYFTLKSSKYKPKNRTWKNHYLRVISDLDNVDPEYIFRHLSGQLGTLKENVNYDMKSNSEKDKNIYWLLNLGNNIKIGYITDRDEELEPVVREYNSDTHFTPAQVIDLIDQFYSEPVSVEELKEQQEIDNPYAEDWSIQDAEQGKIHRYDLIPMFFEGLSENNGIYYVILGS